MLCETTTSLVCLQPFGIALSAAVCFTFFVDHDHVCQSLRRSFGSPDTNSSLGHA